jgi:Fe2+ transport system protein FeoA
VTVTAEVATTCTMCGHRYDPALSVGCNSCPLGAHCSLACCPECGYSAVDLRRSTLARLATRLAGAVRGRGTPATGDVPLASVRPGERVHVQGLDELPAWQCNQLTAYGLAPGRQVEVVQSRPVVIVRVDHVEVAFEPPLARAIRVTRLEEETA